MPTCQDKPSVMGPEGAPLHIRGSGRELATPGLRSTLSGCPSGEGASGRGDALWAPPGYWSPFRAAWNRLHALMDMTDRNLAPMAPESGGHAPRDRGAKKRRKSDRPLRR